MTMGGFAFLLRLLTWWQAAALAALALVANATLLPRIGGGRLYRPAENVRGFPLGILLYPFSVLLLIVVFPSRLDIVAAAWAILAAGDGAATLVGRGIGGTRLPWNPSKTVAGLLAFAISGSIAAVLLAWWTSPAVTPAPPRWWMVAAPITAAIGAALVETIPVALDDNLSVPISAAAILWWMALMTPDSVLASSAAILDRLPWAAAVNAIAAWLGYKRRTVTSSGAVGGALVGIVIYAAGGLAAWLMLLATFLVATLSSRLGDRRKTERGIGEERGGRGAGNALANCGIAVLAAIAMVMTPYRRAAAIAFVTALTAGGSDTAASEAGKAWGGSTFLVTTWGRVPPGTPGAMSLLGTVTGVSSAAVLGALAVVLRLIDWTLVPLVIVASTVGALVESALAATLEAPGILNNDLLNLLNTGVATFVALLLS
jgi:uncharacterized protein (TIGR00297 family)